MINKKYIPIYLIILSFILLFSAVLYYDFSSKVKNYHYSDSEEYENIKQGLDYLDKLPIHFNIINKYFSNINNLKQEEKEEIAMAWVIKNNYRLYDCGPSNSMVKYLCIDKADLNSSDLLDRFNLNLKFINKNIKIYVDDYGTYSVSTTDSSNSYKIVVDNIDNKNFRLYSKFSHYKEDKDKYIFYIYQGYYKGNCSKGEKLDLYDFMTGQVIYSNTCNGNGDFSIDPSNKIKKLQLYKYELKKDKNNKFYLYGYNPVNNLE